MMMMLLSSLFDDVLRIEAVVGGGIVGPIQQKHDPPSHTPGELYVTAYHVVISKMP
jgi:hypothetical protein